MSRSKSSRRGAAKAAFVLQKPSGQLTPRVQAVGPEHFGILSFDCAKQRSRYFLADFYGRVLLEPTTLHHSKGDLQACLDRVRQATDQHGLADLVVAIERTGQYHRPVQRAFRAAGFDTRLVHPFTSKQYRQPADPQNKTDDTDRGAIFRAATQGFGLCEPVWPPGHVTLQMLHRHRRDLVEKNSILKCQILETLHAAMPGYAGCFSSFWTSQVALPLARQTTSAAAVLKAGLRGLRDIVSKEDIYCRETTLARVLAWAEQAPAGSEHSEQLRLVLCDLDDDRLAKCKQIKELERSLAGCIAATPYVLLLAIPGLNVVSVADLAGELGPIELYPNANAITGRAALMPSRYQSDQVDCPNGPLRRRGNRRLRGALMQAADNLVNCNHYFGAQAEVWRRLGKGARWIRVKVAKRLSRLLYAMVAGKQIIDHPCCRERHYILQKLLEFHGEHGTAAAQQRQDLEAVVAQLPAAHHREEAKPLQEHLEALGKRRGVQPLAEIIPIVLARLGSHAIESPDEGAGLS
jgi:transposase